MMGRLGAAGQNIDDAVKMLDRLVGEESDETEKEE